MMPAVLEVRSLSKTYGSKFALKKCSKVSCCINEL